MKRTSRIAAAYLSVALGLVTPLLGSIDRGAIRGTVTDQQGGVIVGAQVVVKNVDTNVQVNLTTNGAGSYLAPELVPGSYSIYVLATGFSAFEESSVKVTAGETLTVDVRLQVGSTSQKVEVTAGAALVDTTPSDFSTDVSASNITEIPLGGRDIQSLVQLVPGVTQSSGPSGALFGFNSQFGGFPDPLHFAGSNVSSNGSQGGASAWYLDGSLNQSVMMQNVVINPSPDSIAEFNVIDNGLAAEWGRTNGAVFNVVLKSGANRLHGDLYGFNRNSEFSATNPFAQRDASGNPLLQPWVNWNDLGATLGGPVVIPHVYDGKNRTFFFVSYDLSFLHERRPTLLTVPLPNEAMGDFTGDPRFAAQCNPAQGISNCLYNPYSTTGPDVNGLFHRTPFPTPVIPAGLIDPVAAFYAATYPAPNFLDPLQQGPSGCGNLCDNFVSPVGSSMTTHNFSVKIDHTLTDKHKFFGEWLFNPSYYTNFRYPWDGPTAATETGVEGAQPYYVHPHIASVGLTSTFTPTLVNEARVVFNRQVENATPNPESVTANSVVEQKVQGLNLNLSEPFQPVPSMTVGGLPGFGVQEWQNALQGVQSLTILDNLTKVISKHTLKTGFMFRRSSAWYNGGWGEQLSFGGALTSDPVSGLGGTGLAQFLLGATDEFGSYSGTYLESRLLMNYWGFFLQDDYRVTPNLSLSVGLRYDLIPYAYNHERHNLVANFNPDLMNPDVPLLGAVVYADTTEHPAKTLVPIHKNDFAPRFSFAWTPFTDRKTVVRGGFGIVYSSTLEIYQGWGGQPTPTSVDSPYNGDFTGERPAFQLSAGAPTILLENPATYISTDQQFLGQEIYSYGLGSKDPYVEQWSLYLQRELPGNLAVSAGYVGTHGLHLLGDLSRVNDYVPVATRLQLRENIHNPVPVNAALGPIYGCPISGGQAQCPGNLVLREFPQYQGIAPDLAADGINKYNSFQLKVEKRTSHGLNFITAYTIQKNIESANFGSLMGNFSTPALWSQGAGRTAHVAGAASGGLADGYSSATAEDPDNRNRYISLAPDDIPQVLNFQVTYDLPVGHGKAFLSRSGVVDKVLGGWKLTQNWNFESGVPTFFTAPCNGISCRPNLIGNPAAGRSQETRQQQENQWYNPAAFEAPFGSDPAVIQGASTGVNPDGTAFNYNSDAWWTFGNIGTRPPSGRMPGYWNADMALAKDFHLSESKYFQFRWDLFNALNHQNLGVPNTGWCLPPIQNSDGSITTDLVHQYGCQFGKITNVQTDPRAMEFALKFYW